MSCLMPQWEKNQWFCCKQQWQDMLHQKQLILNLKPMEFWLRITSIFVQANLYEIDKIWHEMEAHEEMFNNLEYLQHIISNFGIFYEFFWLKHPNIGIFFHIYCQKLRIVYWHQRSNIWMKCLSFFVLHSNLTLLTSKN